MERKMLDYVVKKNNYLPGGTKEACVKVREFLQNAKWDGNEVKTMDYSSVKAEEFVEAVNVLMASAFRKEDEIPETWYCNDDCSKLSGYISCPGKFNIKDESSEECPFFSDSDYI